MTVVDTIRLSAAAWVESVHADATLFQRFLLVGICWMTTALPAGLVPPLLLSMAGIEPSTAVIYGSITAFTVAYLGFAIQADPDVWTEDTDDNGGDRR